MSIATPQPPPEQLAAASHESPPRAPRQRGLAQITREPSEPAQRLDHKPGSAKRPDNPGLDLGTNYPKASPKPPSHSPYPAPKRSYVISYTPPPYSPMPVVGPAPTGYSLPAPHAARYRQAGARIPFQPRMNQPTNPAINQPERPPTPNNVRPAAYPTASYPTAAARPQRPNQDYDSRHQALRQQYLQARADALNIKYNGGRAVFSANSPQVLMSANAPPMNQPMTKAPWDTLGQAFDRSEQIRKEMRILEQSRYSGGSARATVPGGPMRGSRYNSSYGANLGANYRPENQPGYRPENQPDHRPAYQPGYHPTYQPTYQASNQAPNQAPHPGYKPPQPPGF